MSARAAGHRRQIRTITVVVAIVLAVLGLTPTTSSAGPVADPLQPAALTPDGAFNAITPTRFLDTRTGIGAPIGRISAGTSVNVQIANRLGLPAAAQMKAIVMNVTVAEPTSDGYITAYPAGIAVPGVSNINYLTSTTVANLTTVTLGSGGFVSLFNSDGSVHLIADVIGWYSTSSGPDTGNYIGTSPTIRIYDSRTTTAIGPGTTVNIPYTFASWVTAAVVNMTITRATGTGYASAFPAGISPPNASTLNFRGGVDIANVAIVKKGGNGQLAVYNGSNGSIDVLIDLIGVFDDGTYATQFPSGSAGLTLKGTFFATAPFRWIDSRTTERLHPNTVWKYPVPPSIPEDATALVLNATVVDPTENSYIVAYSCNLPTTSTVNFVSGRTTPNQAMVSICSNSTTGERWINVFNAAGHNHVLLDVQGWFA